MMVPEKGMCTSVYTTSAENASILRNPPKNLRISSQSIDPNIRNLGGSSQPMWQGADLAVLEVQPIQLT